jgi:hypothetical protein
LLVVLLSGFAGKAIAGRFCARAVPCLERDG